MKQRFIFILFTSLTASSFAVFSKDFDSSFQARYQVRFEADWSSVTHPIEFPSGAHFSPLFGVTHSQVGEVWQTGQLASTGIELMAELGANSSLGSEVNQLINTGNAEFLLQGSVLGSPGMTSLEFDISHSYPLVSLVTMIAPSPDWFLGVNGLSLRENGQWIEQLSVDLLPYDAGTDDGASFTSGDMDTSPAQSISRITESPFENNISLGRFVFELLETSNNFPIIGQLSGLYYNPKRNGEGINLIIAQQGERRTAAINWYTYQDNQQLWLVGNADFEAGIDVLTLDLFSTNGTEFGAAFNPDDVKNIPWGTVTISVPGCDQLIVDYAGNNQFDIGHLELQRLLGVADFSCE